MRLKSLGLHGFKSFADKTTFEFHPGVTGIVGPNGCGKSNVVDAVRWVLGETSAKALRGGEMADVIFNGTDKRQPVGMAEVVLTLTDCEEELGTEFHEVALSRRVTRDGKSEYRINNQLCRLKDINDLLADTGMGQTAYSIMEQGKIDLLLSSKPEDRRAVFEEAAGITRFKSQKKEALRKLDYTEANLVRIADIIAEVVRQKNSLQRQAAKARRYQALHADVCTLDTHLAHRRHRLLQAERAELETSLGDLHRRQDTLHEAIRAAEVEVEEARGGLQHLEHQIEATRQKGNELENRVHAARNRIAFNGERSDELTSLVERNEADIAETRGRLDEQRSEIESTHETLGRVSDSITRQQQQLDEHEAKTASIRERRAELTHKIEDLRRLTSDDEAEAVAIESQLASSLTQIESDGQRREQLASELARLESERNARSREMEEASSRLASLRDELAAQTEASADAERASRDAEARHEQLKVRRAELEGELSRKSSRLEVLRQAIAKGEGLEKGTREVLRGLGQPDVFKPGVRGVLTSFLEVEDRFIPAIEAALGPFLQTILVTDAALAESIVAALREGRLGEASLMPEDHGGPAPAASGRDRPLPDGAVAWAIDQVTIRNGFRPLVERILDGVVVVPDLATALRLREGHRDLGLAFATLEGDWLGREGVVTGGAGRESDSHSLLHRQNEVRDLAAAVAALESERAETETALAEAHDRLSDLRMAADEARTLLQDLRVSESTLAGQLSLLEREVGQMNAKLGGVEWEQGELFKRVESAELRVGELRERQTAARQRVGERREEIQRLESELAGIARRESESAELLSELRTALAVERRAEQALRQQQEPMAHRLHELQEAIARREAEIASYRERIEGASAESARLEGEVTVASEEAARVKEALAALEADRRTRDEAIRGTERRLMEQRRELGELSEQRGREEVRTTQLDLRLESLAGGILERYGVELEHFEPDAHALLGAIEEQKKARARHLKRKATLEARNAPDDGDDDETSDAPGGSVEPSARVEAADLHSDVGEGDETDSLPDETDDDAAAEAPDLDGDEGPDWDFVESVVGELRRKLDSMGPVNLDAIEEFEELEERHRFLEEQHGDLVHSKEELLRVIDKINKTTREMFAETFSKVRQNFRQTFRELFGQGARSDLVLVDEDDPLESGIDIIARPPGKKPTSISLLSGGERSMTAVALLFSIYMVKPSPFCVLDELDAPLDESNIGRFLRMLDRFIDQSQFVIVTHNKRTMKRCDVMYGVTMQEFGVSKPVGMKLTGDPSEGGTESAGRRGRPADPGASAATTRGTATAGGPRDRSQRSPGGRSDDAADGPGEESDADADVDAEPVLPS